MKGFDCAAPAGLHAEKLAACGYQFFARYYRRTLVSRWAVSPEETAPLFKAGLWMLSVFQNTSNTPAYFTAENAAADAAAALAKAFQMGQPLVTAIYFAVDCNPSAAEMPAIEAYFAVIKEAFRDSDYIVGGYGSGLVLQTLLAKGLIEKAWLSNAKAWHGSRAFDAWHVKQTSLPILLPFELEVDENEARSAYDAGLWRPE